MKFTVLLRPEFFALLYSFFEPLTPLGAFLKRSSCKCPVLSPKNPPAFSLERVACTTCLLEKTTSTQRMNEIDAGLRSFHAWFGIRSGKLEKNEPHPIRNGTVLVYAGETHRTLNMLLMRGHENFSGYPTSPLHLASQQEIFSAARPFYGTQFLKSAT